MLIELTTRYLFTNVRIIIHKLRKDLPKGKKKKKNKIKKNKGAMETPMGLHEHDPRIQSNS